MRGRVVRDRIHLGEEIGAVDVTFGCTMEEKGSIFRQEADGLMGMGRANDMSMPVQLSRRHGLADVFSLCYNNFTGGGALTFGRAKGMGDGEAHADHPENSLGFTPLKRTGNKNFYGVDVESMTMNGETFGTEAEFAVGRGSVMDSGTTMTYVPASVFKKLTKALQDAAEKNDANLKGGSNTLSFREMFEKSQEGRPLFGDGKNHRSSIHQTRAGTRTRRKER